MYSATVFFCSTLVLRSIHVDTFRWRSFTLTAKIYSTEFNVSNSFICLSIGRQLCTFQLLYKQCWLFLYMSSDTHMQKFLSYTSRSWFSGTHGCDVSFQFYYILPNISPKHSHPFILLSAVCDSPYFPTTCINVCTYD